MYCKGVSGGLYYKGYSSPWTEIIANIGEKNVRALNDWVFAQVEERNYIVGFRIRSKSSMYTTHRSAILR
jgi:hypothetical protein